MLNGKPCLLCGQDRSPNTLHGYCRECKKCLPMLLASANERIAELERRARLNGGGHLPCSDCGGPHQFDTSVPSVIWNAVMRKDGREGPEYICTTCIVREFALAGVSFVAELYGGGFSGLPIEIHINSEDARAAAKIQDENNALRWKLAQVEGRLRLFGLDKHPPAADAVDPHVTDTGTPSTRE